MLYHVAYKLLSMNFITIYYIIYCRSHFQLSKNKNVIEISEAGCFYFFVRKLGTMNGRDKVQDWVWKCVRSGHHVFNTRYKTLNPPGGEQTVPINESISVVQTYTRLVLFCTIAVRQKCSARYKWATHLDDRPENHYRI